ncbi:MAG TPA: glycosyltransferase [Longimicrobium sp.]|jgi:glycosyltransferase involved in cell wall biosynthesis
MQNLRVALVQNQVGMDGRSRMLGEVVVLFNEMGITPDVLTLASDDGVDLWRRTHRAGETMRFRIVRPLRVPFVRGSVYQSVLINWLSRNMLREYDLLVNSNNYLGFLPKTVRRLHYIHFPLGQVFFGTERYRRPHWMIASLPLRLLLSRTEEEILPGDVTCTNSAYTAHWVQRQWPGVDAEVIGGPVEMPDSPERNGVRDIDVVTVGAINPDKDQLLQVRIAARFPERKFVLIGYNSAPRYYEMVMRSIRELGVKNVQVITDAARDEIPEYLRRSRVFLHTKRDEHFGISIAEAVGHGCMPVIHDSGGQVEIVPDARLRYKDADQAVQILTRLLADDSGGGAEIAALQEHVRQFRPEAFRARFAALVRRALAGGSPAGTSVEAHAGSGSPLP